MYGMGITPDVCSIVLSSIVRADPNLCSFSGSMRQAYKEPYKAL